MSLPEETFNVVRLSEVATITDSLHSTPAYSLNGYPMVRVTDVRDFYLETEASLKVGKEIFKEFTRRETPQQGDIVFTRVGSYGNSCLALQDGNFCLGQNTALIRPHIDPHYLLFCLKSPFVKEQIESSVVGSTQKTISIKSIKDLLIPIHSKEEIASISQSLSSLQTKIELNRKTNETLEAMAKALFKSWFVDFDPVRAKAEGRPTGLPAEISDLFPDSFEDSELGEIPRGWQVGCLSDCCEIIMGQSPPGDTYNDEGVGLPFYQGKTDFGFRFPGRRIYCSSPTRQASIGATLISVRAPVGSANIAREVCSIGRGIAALKSRQSADSFIYYLIGSLQGVFESYNSEGTVFGAINGKDLASIQIVAPSTEAIAAFNSQCLPMDESIQSNTLETEHLTTIRDTLLSKLISGELRIPDAEKLLEKVGI
jgi:type I restriction enzyme S subunit